MPEVITNNLDIWTSALRTRSTVGRGSNGKLEAYGIKKLRKLILELAVRGKLVPQDPNDEPATELLKRTTSEKKRLIKEEVIRETKAPALPDESPEHPLPQGWVWTNLYEIGEISPRNDADDDTEASFVPMQLISEDYGVPVQHEMKKWKEIKTGFTHFKEEDVVLAKITPCFQNGKSAVMRGLTNGFGAGTTELHVYRPINTCTVPEYVLIYLKSPRFIGDGIPKMTGTAGQKRITRDYFAGNYFPLPPLTEQQRIVAKVDELMAQCDQLEKQQTNGIEAHQALVEILLGTLARVESQQELTEAWTRITNHFDTLFTTEQSVDQLKETILQLAVMGKLVAQDPNDEPANVLIKKVAEFKKGKELRLIPDDERPFKVKKGWRWVSFGDFFEVTSSKRIHVSDYVTEGVPFFRSKEIGELNKGRSITTDIFISREKFDELKNMTGFPHVGDLMLTSVGSIGNTWICDGRDFYYKDGNITKIGAHEYADMRYVQCFIDAPIFTSQVIGTVSGTAYNALTIVKLNNLSFPLPPLQEQHSIVAKVDELMALCDALKARLNDAQILQIHLADAIVEQAVA